MGGTYTDQNWAPTPPSRRRGMSVTAGGVSLLVSWARSMALKSLLRLRYCHGRSLWPSMSGTSRRSWRTSARVAASGFGTVADSAANALVVIIEKTIAPILEQVLMRTPACDWMTLRSSPGTRSGEPLDHRT